MTIKVLMKPHLDKYKEHGFQSGIRRVVEAYFKHLPEYDIELVPQNATSYDLVANHAGEGGPIADVAHCHGLYWSADLNVSQAELKANANVIAAVRNAKEVTVPSRWVAEVFERDMRFTPHVIPHAVPLDEWQNRGNGKFALWNKNRISDVCSPAPVAELARIFPNMRFVSTFAPENVAKPSNMQITGHLSHAEMKKAVESCGLYLSLVKETFGIGVKEAMAAGKPILGWAYGGNLDLVEHGINGYLARPGDYDDLAAGVQYCLTNWQTLGANSRKMAEQYTWQAACEQVANVYRLANTIEPPDVSVIVPFYNYGDKVGRALDSLIKQTHAPKEVIIVNDGSSDEEVAKLKEITATLAWQDIPVRTITQENSGVAVARNKGIEEAKTPYVMCLDPDDAVDPRFIEVCVAELEADRSLGLAYTGLMSVMADGTTKRSDWPSEWSFDAHLGYFNQVPTCNVMRKEAWRRCGGYRKRFAPDGAGSEDANLWTLMGAHGWGAKMATPAPFFIYSLYTGHVSGNRKYTEVNWLDEYPWVHDRLHPFASLATPRNKQSHLVRQYDEPVISVIIPVGPGHEHLVRRALDSLEAQTYRKWEVVLAWDNPVNPPELLTAAYPYARIVDARREGKAAGAGHARNVGVDASRAPFIIYLDADDFFTPLALESMLKAWNETQSIIYSDYVFKAHINDAYAEELRRAGRLKTYNGEDKAAVIGHSWREYDCEIFHVGVSRGKMTHWCLVNCLMPKAWHYEIGGFDETMESWEDVDYFWRLAWIGKCFTRVAQELVVYRFDTGSRRYTASGDNPESLQIGNKLLQYMLDKLKGMEDMSRGCSGCGGKKSTTPVINRPMAQGSSGAQVNTALDAEMVKVEYMLDSMGRANRASHEVIGAAIFRDRVPELRMRKKPGGFCIVYGSRKCGNIFYVHNADIDLAPHRFREVKEYDTVQMPAEQVQPTAQPQRLSGAIPIDTSVEVEEFKIARPFNLQLIPGVSKNIADQLIANGIDSAEKLLALGKEGLIVYNGVADKKADAMLTYARQKTEMTNAN